jgi:hypothetical protein
MGTYKGNEMGERREGRVRFCSILNLAQRVFDDYACYY